MVTVFTITIQNKIMPTQTLARQAVHWLSDEEFNALKVPPYANERALAVATFIIALSATWVQTRYIKDDNVNQYLVNFNADKANEYVKDQSRWWLSRCMLPVDWYYMHKKDNIGWLNLSNVVTLQSTEYNKKKIKTFATGIMPADPAWNTHAAAVMKSQEEKHGIKVRVINQQELINQALAKPQRKHAGRY